MRFFSTYHIFVKQLFGELQSLSEKRHKQVFIVKRKSLAFRAVAMVHSGFLPFEKPVDLFILRKKERYDPLSHSRDKESYTVHKCIHYFLIFHIIIQAGLEAWCL